MSLDLELKTTLGTQGFDIQTSIPLEGISTLFGPSGCGKTTLLRFIAGLDHHPHSKLFYQQESWQEQSRFLPTHQRQCGFVFQEPTLFEHLDVYKNIQYGLQRTKNSILWNIEDIIDLFALTPLLKRNCSSLSGGEKQKVALARTLASQPKLILMDEPLASLDHSTKKELLPHIRSLWDEYQIPIIYVTHDLEELVFLSDHILLIDQGQRLAHGATQALLTDLSLPLAFNDSACNLIQLTEHSFDTQYQLIKAPYAHQHLWIPSKAAHSRPNLRVNLLAKDISLSSQPLSESSISNTFKATYLDYRDLKNGTVVVRVQCGSGPLISKITFKSFLNLNLQPNQPVYLHIKSVALKI